MGAPNPNSMGMSAQDRLAQQEQDQLDAQQALIAQQKKRQLDIQNRNQITALRAGRGGSSLLDDELDNMMNTGDSNLG